MVESGDNDESVVKTPIASHGFARVWHLDSDSGHFGFSGPVALFLFCTKAGKSFTVPKLLNLFVIYVTQTQYFTCP